MIADAKIERVMRDTGMDRIQAYRHVQQREELQRRLRVKHGIGRDLAMGMGRVLL